MIDMDINNNFAGEPTNTPTQAISELRKIRREADLRSWFENYYSLLGYEEIIASYKTRTPDFVMKEDGEEKNVELEIKSSNFFKHGHDFKNVDQVVCIIENQELPVETRTAIDILEIVLKNEGKRRIDKVVDNIKSEVTGDIIYREKTFPSTESDFDYENRDEEEIPVQFLAGETARRARRLVNVGVYNTLRDLVVEGINLALEEGEKEIEKPYKETEI